MKISDVSGPLLPEMNGQKTAKSKTNGTFRKVMGEIIQEQEGNATRACSPHSVQPSANISPARVIQGVNVKQDIQPEARVMKEVESALNLADFYAAKLGDPDVGTASLEPLVTYLEEKLEGLRFLKKQGNMDQRLKGIISELDIAFSTEVARFRRGDYY